MDGAWADVEQTVRIICVPGRFGGERLSLSKTLSGWRAGANRVMLIAMVDGLILLRSALTSLFRSRARLEAEILVLRQQINALRRKSPKRSVFRTFDRWCSLGCIASLPGNFGASQTRRPDLDGSLSILACRARARSCKCHRPAANLDQKVGHLVGVG